MQIEYASHFARRYRKLPLKVQIAAERKEIIFRRNPFDRKLKTHKLHGKLNSFYSFSVDQKYRIVFSLTVPSKAVFLDVGDHDIYWQ